MEYIKPETKEKIDIDKQRIEIDLIKAEATLNKNIDNNDNIPDDGFIEALNSTISDVWDDDD